jgi:hypothetical protein
MATITLPEAVVQVSRKEKSDVMYVYFFGGGRADGNGKMKTSSAAKAPVWRR